MEDLLIQSPPANHFEREPASRVRHPRLDPELQAALWLALTETLSRVNLPLRTTSGPVAVQWLRPALAPLSAREREVLICIAAGDSNKLIARALDLSLHTVKRLVANILDKLDADSRGQAAAWWQAHREAGL